MLRVALFAAGASAFRPHSAAPRPQRAPLRAGDDGCAEAVEGDVVAFVFPETGDRPDLAGARRLGVVKAEMSCTAWVQPLVEQGADQGDDDCMLVEDESFEEEAHPSYMMARRLKPPSQRRDHHAAAMPPREWPVMERMLASQLQPGPPAPDAQLPFVAARCKAAAALWKAAAKKPKILTLSAGTAHVPQLLDAVQPLTSAVQGMAVRGVT